MLLTLKDLRDQVLRRLDEAGDTSTTKDLVNDLLNNANAHRAVEYQNAFLVLDHTFTTEVGRQEYSLHEDFVRPLYFLNRNTHRYLEEVPERQIEQERYDLYARPGLAQHFALWGRAQVWRQPPSPSPVFVVSDNAADAATAPQVMIRGERTDGMVVAEIFTPNGTTPIQSVHSYRKIFQVTRAGAWTGTLTLSDQDGTTLLVLPFCDLGKSYQQLFLFETPLAAETIAYRFYRMPTKLYNDYDQPDIPPPFSQVLVYDALLQIAGYNTEINGQALGVWRDQQSRWETALAQTVLEGQSLGARVRFVRTYETTHGTRPN